MGVEGDATAFSYPDIEKNKKLESFGYDKDGYEYLYNGMTGKKLKYHIFIVPTYEIKALS